MDTFDQPYIDVEPDEEPEKEVQPMIYTFTFHDDTDYQVEVTVSAASQEEAGQHPNVQRVLHREPDLHLVNVRVTRPEEVLVAPADPFWGRGNKGPASGVSAAPFESWAKDHARKVRAAAKRGRS